MARKRLAKSRENNKKNSLSRAIVAEEWEDVPVFLAKVLTPAQPLLLLAVRLLPRQLGLFVSDEDVVSSSRDHPGMGSIEAGNVPLKRPQVLVKERIQEIDVAQGAEVWLP